MTNYLLVYRGGGMAETEAAREASMAAWGRWFEELGAAVVDHGNPVGRTEVVATSGTTAGTVTGYSVIAADSFDDAVKLAGGCPILPDGGSVEVAETFAIM